MLSTNLILKVLLVSTVLQFHIACDEEVDNRQLVSWSSADQGAQAGAIVEIYLPDRSQLQIQNSEGANLINAYFLQIAPEGQRCPDSNVIEILDHYSDLKLIDFVSYKNCNYRVDLRIGNADPQVLAAQGGSSLNLQTNQVNYKDHIRPLIQQHCLSCHPDYTSYDGIFEQAVEIAFQVENRLMPPDQGLENQDIALFIAWQANDFAELDPSKSDDASSQSQLAQVYFRNNLNTMIFEYILLNRSRFTYQDSLWLQSDGEAAGIETIEWLVLEAQKD